MEAGRYLIRIEKPLAWLSEKHRTQVASFNPTLGKDGKFYVSKGSAGHVSIAKTSATVICKLGRDLGSGIHMAEQPWTQDPQLGDYFWDADLGDWVWDGSNWISCHLTTQKPSDVGQSHITL